MTRRHDPWVGQNFADGLVGGRRALLLGESHYAPDLGATITSDTVKAFAIDAPSRFFESLRWIASGLSPVLPPTEFWNKVAFANVVQRVMTCPKERPSVSDIQEGHDALRQTIQELRPDVVFAFSAASYDSLPTSIGFGDGNPAYPGVDVIWEYPLELKHMVVVGRFNHPSRLNVPSNVWKVFAQQVHVLSAQRRPHIELEA